jgi:hypothetical protein
VTTLSIADHVKNGGEEVKHFKAPDWYGLGLKDPAAGK